jgi:large subunit ribosomal protein L17
MNKRKQGRKFGMKTDQRKALIKSLITALISKERITTTKAKAKELSMLMDRMITKARNGDVATRRQLAKKISYKSVKKLVEVIAPRYKDRKGGYTRVLKIGFREGDAAQMAIIELVK